MSCLHKYVCLRNFYRLLLTILSFSPCSSCDCEKRVDGLCETDPTQEGLKIRYYDVDIVATDSAGNAGSDTCRVVIIPSCDLAESDDCEEYNGASYYSKSAVDASVDKSQVLNEAASEGLVWQSNLMPPEPSLDSVEVAVVDNKPPVVECGFYPQLSNSINIIQGETLYHYMLDDDGDQMRLNDAGFYYNLTVSLLH